MFNKIKHLKELRNQAKTLQGALGEKTVTVERRGVTLVMDGNQEVKSLNIPEGLSREDLQEILPKLFNEANDKVKRIMAETMRSMGGFNLPGM